MKTARSVFVLLLTAGLGACAGTGTQSAGAASAQAQSNGASCPVSQLPGVRATVGDTSDGAAVTFTGPENEVDQLREQVRAMADANDNEGNPFAACPCAFNHRKGSTEAMPKSPNSQNDIWNGRNERDSERGSASMQSSPHLMADARVEEISTGAVLKLSAKDKGQVQPLRSEVRSALRSMRNNGCLGH